MKALNAFCLCDFFEKMIHTLWGLLSYYKAQQVSLDWILKPEHFVVLRKKKKNLFLFTAIGKKRQVVVPSQDI